MHFFRVQRLTTELARSPLPPGEQSQYLLAGMLVWTVAFYFGFAWHGPALWTIANLFEGIAVIAVHVVGVSSAYRASGGARNPHFVSDFTCLSFPIKLTTVMLVWAASAGIQTLLFILAVRNGNHQLITDWEFHGFSANSAISSIAYLLVLVAVYARLKSQLAKLYTLRSKA